MSDLGTQIRDYLDLTAPAVETERIAQAPDGDGHSTRLVPSWVVAAGFAAAVLLVIGIPAAFFLRGDSGDVAGTDAPTPTAAVTATTPSPATNQAPTAIEAPPPTRISAPAAPAIAWQRIDLDEPAEAASIVAGGPGYLRGGTVCETVDFVVCARQRPAIWASTDALAWQRVADETFTGVNGGISDIAVGPAGFVAVGIGRRTDDAFDRGLVWRSLDGVTWTAVPDDEGVFVGSGFAVVKSVSAGGPGYVAVGWENPGGKDTNAVVWVSEDGTSWARIADPDLLGNPAESDYADLQGVVSGDGGLVGWGSAVWVSADGTDWELGADLQLGLVTSSPESGILIGLTHSGEVWRSSDGEQWIRLRETDGSLFDGGAVAAAWDAQTVLILGHAEDLSSPAVWTSIDSGDSWLRVDSELFAPGEGRSVQFGGVIFDGSRFVISGADCDGLTGDDCRGVIWAGTPAD